MFIREIYIFVMYIFFSPVSSGSFFTTHIVIILHPSDSTLTTNGSQKKSTNMVIKTHDIQKG